MEAHSTRTSKKQLKLNRTFTAGRKSPAERRKMVRIKNLELAAYRCFNGSTKQFDKYYDRNNLQMKKLFDDTKSGAIKGFYLVSDKDFKAYHRSPKQPGKIQLSVGFFKNGELIPTYDVQLENFEDLTREGYEPGRYETIA